MGKTGREGYWGGVKTGERKRKMPRMQMTILSQPTPPRCRVATRRRRGLTLMETALATVIVGVAVLSLVKLMTVTTQQTGYSQKLTNAYMLANQVRESTGGLTFSQVQALNGVSYAPPIDSNGQPINNLSNWQQSISVQPVGDVNGQLLNGTGGTYSVVERVRVTISYRASPEDTWTPIVTNSWWKTLY